MFILDKLAQFLHNWNIYFQHLRLNFYISTLIRSAAKFKLGQVEIPGGAEVVSVSLNVETVIIRTRGCWAKPTKATSINCRRTFEYLKVNIYILFFGQGAARQIQPLWENNGTA